MITALVAATGIALAPVPLDTTPNQNEYLSIAHEWLPGKTDDELTQLAMKTCVSLHPYGPKVSPTDALMNKVESILITQYHMDPETATAYVVLVQADLCP